MGKTTLMQEIFRQDIEAGRGCGLIDPQGDVAERALSFIPRHRVDDVVYLDPTLSRYRIVINPFYRPPKDENARALLSYNILSTFKHLWHDNWGETRMQYILTNLIFGLMDAPEHLRPTMMGIPIMAIDAGYRTAVLSHVKNANVKRFFTEEMAQYGSNFLAEALAPIQNRIGQFLTHPAMRHTFGSYKPTVDFQEIIDQGRILIVRIPKGVFGEEPTNYFGSFTMAGLQAAAMSRAHLPEQKRKPFFLNVDEFQNFGTDASAQVFSESRKFKFYLTVAHQYLDQLQDEVLEAIFGNVGSYISFRMREEDAQRLAKGIDGFNARTISGLGKGEVVAQLMQDGMPSEPIQGCTHSPAKAAHCNEANIKRQCRQRYYHKRETIERQVTSWLNQFGKKT